MPSYICPLFGCETCILMLLTLPSLCCSSKNGCTGFFVTASLNPVLLFIGKDCHWTIWRYQSLATGASLPNHTACAGFLYIYVCMYVSDDAFRPRDCLHAMHQCNWPCLFRSPSMRSNQLVYSYRLPCNCTCTYCVTSSCMSYYRQPTAYSLTGAHSIKHWTTNSHLTSTVNWIHTRYRWS